MKSIRKHLIVSLLAGLMLLFFAAAASLFLYTRSAFIAQFDDALIAKLTSFSGMSEAEAMSGAVRIELEFIDFPFPEYEPSDDAEYYQVWREDGTVFARSPSLEGKDLTRIEVEPRKNMIRDILLPDGRQGRAAALWFTPVEETDPPLEPDEPATEGADEPAYLLVLARSREKLDHTLLTLLAGFLATAALLMTGVVLIVRKSVGMGLTPLDRIAAETEAIESTRLSFRFSTRDLPRELIPIGHRLNELLMRLESAFARERRFNADIAHELRTPIAELRALAEVALKAGDDAGIERSQSYFEDALAIARQMDKLVSTLLALVRCEADQQGVRKSEFDLVDVIRKTIRPFEETARKSEINVEVILPETAVMVSDPDLISAVLVNLFCNAVTHTPRGGSITCRLERSGSVCRFRLANNTNRLAPKDLDHLFEPLWKKDPARTDAQGSGLGLAVVAAYAKLLDLEPNVSLDEAGLFEIAFDLESQKIA